MLFRVVWVRRLVFSEAFDEVLGELHSALLTKLSTRSICTLITENAKNAKNTMNQAENTSENEPEPKRLATDPCSFCGREKAPNLCLGCRERVYCAKKAIGREDTRMYVQGRTLRGPFQR